MNTNTLVDPLLSNKNYQELLENLKEKNIVNVNGLLLEGLGHFIYSLDSHKPSSKLILTYDDKRAQRIYEDIKGLGKDDVYIFEGRENLFYDTIGHSEESSFNQIQSMEQFLSGGGIVIATLESLLNKIMAPKDFVDHRVVIDLDSTLDIKKLRQILVDSGYESVNQVAARGQFAIRGGIIDIYPPTEKDPIRIELFDIEVDSIRTFDLYDQRSIENIEKLTIAPVCPVLIDNRDYIIKNIEKSLKSTNYESKKIQEVAYEKYQKIIEKLKQNLTIDNIDLLIPFMKQENLSSIIDYLDEDGLIIVDEPRRVETKYDTFSTDLDLRIKDLMSMGEAIDNQERVVHNYEDVVIDIKQKVLTFSNILSANKYFRPQAIISINMIATTPYNGRMDILREEIKRYQYRGYKIVILATGKERQERIRLSLEGLGFNPKIVEDLDEKILSNEIFIVPGMIQSGFEYSDLKLAILNHREIYGTTKKTTRKRSADEEPIDFSTIKVGDYVVHESHGIGIYNGTQQIDMSGIKRDYMVVKYKGADILYVPTDQLDLLHKYSGATKDGPRPTIHRLDSAQWQRTKQRVQKSIDDITDELIDLYSNRQNTRGFAFSPDSQWQAQFEDAFPYEETRGQLESIRDIKSDMEIPRPMDRLLCADVGFGKTEVALRAAFKAIMDQKQVAILVPTTILAQQHYNTLKERFKDFPVEIGILSRFRTQKQIKEDLQKLSLGMMDIVVGTHRLLSKDVEFYDIGLLIIDEEQRFGVRHKETIRMLKESVDTLTLTATPIPRTLQMSMMGIRDMSVIDEPPKERFPVQSYVTEFNPSMIREAILREKARGGQVFFVYNQVNTIENMAEKLRELVPEVSISIAHGQMGEHQLEETFYDFINGGADVLLSTTIIETGLDIQNANTIIIYNADKFGLSQLYQLRGRVGRSNRAAYAYFTFQKNKQLTEIAERRLLAIREFTEFGSGFKIAMRDLEIRGAGNILGSSQHGHVDSVGYDLYMALLDDTMKEKRGEKPARIKNTLIELEIGAYIPDGYIEDQVQRLEFYKKISMIKTEKDYYDLTEEAIDRFGDMPKPVLNLLDISYIKALASIRNIEKIKGDDQQVVLEFDDPKTVTMASINQIIGEYRSFVEISFNQRELIMVKKDKDILNELKNIVETIEIQ